jgi:hypothetical protein
MDSVQKRSICTNVPSSQTLRSYEYFYLMCIMIEVAVACKKTWKISSHGRIKLTWIL